MTTGGLRSAQVDEGANGRPAEDRLGDLLQAYDSTLRTLRTIPRIQRGRCIVKHGVPPFRFRWGARHFAAFGIGHTVRTLKRGYQAGAALRPDSEADKRCITRVEQFESSLPPIPGKRVLVGFVALAGALGYLVAAVLLPSVHADDVIGQLSGAVTSLDPEKAVTTVKDDPKAAALAAGLLFSFLWVMTYPFLAAFRLNRLVFNLYPDPLSQLRAGAHSDLRPLATGIYELEAKAAEAAGVARPREFPFDLALQAASIVVVFPLWVVAAFTLDDLAKDQNLASAMKAMPWVFIGGLVLWSPGRLIRLWRIWRSRNASPVPLAVMSGPVSLPTAAAPGERALRLRPAIGADGSPGRRA